MEPEERLDQALRESDERSREGRKQRIIWFSKHTPTLGPIMGRAEPLHLLEEVRVVFVHEQYAATLVLCMAVIEHCLLEELDLRSKANDRPGFAEALKRSTPDIIPAEWRDALEILAKRRNAYVHFKEDEHEHGIAFRLRAARKHPKTIMEDDAKEAIVWMYRVFLATLREAA